MRILIILLQFLWLVLSLPDNLNFVVKMNTSETPLNKNMKSFSEILEIIFSVLE